MSDDNEYPWPTLPLGELAAEMCLGKMLDKEKNRGVLKPYLRNVNVRWFGFDLSDMKEMRFEADETTRFGLQNGDLVVCEGGEPGRAAVWREQAEEALIQKALHRIRFRTNEYDPVFAMYFINYGTITSRFAEFYTGSTIKHLTGQALSKVRFPIPPLAEQRRIVAKIEELFSDLDAGIAALERAKANLKRYRAAVLKAAVEGKLTEAWRAEHPNTEPASKLLERILIERRKKWEADQLAKFAAAEREPPKNWKEKYVEPPLPDTTGLPALPERWCWATLPQIGVLDRGRSRHRPRNAAHLYGGPYPFVQTGDIRHADTFIQEYHQTYSEAGLEQSRLWPAGTMCITIAANIAETAILGFDACFPDSVVGFIPFSEGASVRFVEFFFRTVQQRLEAYAPATAQKNINLETLTEVCVTLPPMAEQALIVSEVDARLSTVTAAFSEIERSERRASRLRQSILKQAFEGKLVPQNPNDEPISEELLNKLIQDKDTTATSPKKRNESARDTGLGTPMDPQLTALVAPYLTGQRQAIRLHSLHFDGQFRSLSSPNLDFNRSYHADSSVSPVCLVGLNGSGKSNLIELLAVILCDLELALIGYSKIPQAIKQLKGPPFQLSFSITPKRGKADGIIHISRTAPPKPRVIFSLEVDGESHEISDAATQLDLLPNKIVSYSSGLNETLSIPFLRNQAYYSEQVTQEAFGKRQPSDHGVKDIVTTYMDYDCNAAILLANFLFRSPKQLSIFQDAIRVKSLESFSILYRLKRPRGGKLRSVRLTKELRDILAKLKKCATSVTPRTTLQGERFDYRLDRECRKRFQSEFENAGQFFSCINKLSQLNSLSMSDRDRKYYLRSEDTSSMLERPPAVSREDRIFLIDDVQLRLSSPDAVVSYTGLSDGEHQFVQVFGSLLLFDEPGTLFLFDEPETHFNPQWRRFFVDYLNKIDTTKKQEIVISTHSPFVVSGCRRDGVYKFLRNGDSVTIDHCSLETFGSSYEVLLAELFNLDAMISEQALTEMKKVLEKDDANEIIRDAARFGDSMEKRFLYERAAVLRGEEKVS